MHSSAEMVPTRSYPFRGRRLHQHQQHGGGGKWGITKILLYFSILVVAFWMFLGIAFTSRVFHMENHHSHGKLPPHRPPPLPPINVGAKTGDALGLLSENGENKENEKLSIQEARLTAQFLPIQNQPGPAVLRFYKDPNCAAGSEYFEIVDSESETMGVSLCTHAKKLSNVEIKSMRLDGNSKRIVDIYERCDGRRYVASLYHLDGCVNVYHYPLVVYVKFQDSNLDKKQIEDDELKLQFELQDHKPQVPENGIAGARIVFSCESSEYFGYQVWTNFYGFLTSGQTSATWTRLLTSSERDDLPEHNRGLATFAARRHLYSRRYSPINKADVITKWYASADRPKEEVIVVIDPDNWLLRDVKKWVDEVAPGQAVGEAAYYEGSGTARKLWRELCKVNCDADIDMVGVPYVVHRDDLEVIAPLWRDYSLLIKESMESRSPNHDQFAKDYKPIDVNWAAEMFGYNFASAHAGVKHKVVRRMQVRDVDSERRKEVLKDVAMIHMGRAWFPKSYEPAAIWAHTEGQAFRHLGVQVWCKCNYTASTILPWPVPEDADFQSTKTLQLMHGAYERFGEIPVNTKFRRGTLNQRLYHGSSYP